MQQKPNNQQRLPILEAKWIFKKFWTRKGIYGSGFPSRALLEGFKTTIMAKLKNNCIMNKIRGFWCKLDEKSAVFFPPSPQTS
jgi:hypothetical protein